MSLLICLASWKCVDFSNDLTCNVQSIPKAVYYLNFF